MQQHFIWMSFCFMCNILFSINRDSVFFHLKRGFHKWGFSLGTDPGTDISVLQGLCKPLPVPFLLPKAFHLKEGAARHTKGHTFNLGLGLLFVLVLYKLPRNAML